MVIEKTRKTDSRWGVASRCVHYESSRALSRLTVISAFFNTEDIFSFFCHLLSPFLLFLKPKSLVWTKTVFEKCLSVLTGCELRDRLLLANPAWASHHSHFENLSLAPSFSPSLYVREERDGPYERSGKRMFTIYNESESSMLFPVSETCCYDVSSSHESLWCPWHRRTHSDARKRNIITAQNRWEV